MITLTHLRKNLHFATAMAAAMLFAYGCGASRDAVGNSPYVWPQPPDDARVRYLRTYTSEADFPSALGGLTDLVGGKSGRIALLRPFDLVVDSSGRLYVSDVEQGIIVFDEKEKKVEVFGEHSSIPLETPRGIAYGNGKIFLGLQKPGMVVALSTDGRLLNTIGKPGRFVNPVGVEYDQKNHRIIVIDNGTHQVYLYSEKGDSLLTIGKRGDADGEFNFPQAATVDASGNIYVVDAFNFRIQVFDENGTFLRKYGSQGDQFGQFARPKGIALDTHGNIYVVDAVHQNFQIFNANFDLLLFVGRFAADNWGFQNPIGIAIDASNRIYVADQLNSRVQVFQLVKGD
jgi:DNA-binding beta-propeller fold protein YncE